MSLIYCPNHSGETWLSKQEEEEEGNVSALFAANFANVHEVLEKGQEQFIGTEY